MAAPTLAELQTAPAAEGFRERRARHRNIVLTISVDSEDFDTVNFALSALRSGFVSQFQTSDPHLSSCEYEGPFEVNTLDMIVLQTFADAQYDEGTDEREPEKLVARGVRLAARMAASHAFNVPMLTDGDATIARRGHHAEPV